MKLLLTRHGETEENKVFMMQGHLPGTLSTLGKQQAKDLAQRLVNEKIDLIISSDLARSYDTALIASDILGLNVIPTELLREIDFGPQTGGRLDKLDWSNLPNGCETLEQLYMRAGAFLDWLKENYQEKTVLVVGHGAIDRAIVAYLRGLKPIEMIDLPIIKNTYCEEYEI